MKKLLISLLALVCVGIVSFTLVGCNGETPPADEVYEEE